MKTIRGIAASLSCAIVAAIGFATPAWADGIGGTYEIDMGGETATWTIVPCGMDSFIPCAHVAQSGGEMEPWVADAKLSVGYWTVHVERSDTIICNDGEKFPARTTYSWDAVTLAGWLGARDTGVCGDAGGSLAAPFTLTKIGPAGMGAPGVGPETGLPETAVEVGAPQVAPEVGAPEVNAPDVGAPVLAAEA